MKEKKTSYIKSATIWTILYAAPLFISAKSVFWWNGLLYLGVNLASLAYLYIFIYSKSPDLLQERATAMRNTKTWDKIIVPLVVALLPLTMNILAGLDKRFGWTCSISTLESVMALILYIFAVALVDYSMKVNSFFSSHFNIQKERGHVVVERGPYSLVRHPGYLGMIVGNLALPILLGSMPSLWVGVLTNLLLILRTKFEDDGLKKELNGYQEYSQKVKYRLVPFIW